MLYIWHWGQLPNLLKVLEQVSFDGHIQVFSGQILIKLAWIVHLNILMYMYLTRSVSLHMMSRAKFTVR